MDTKSSCTVDTTLKVIGGKWKPIILWHLTEKTLRFGELQKRIPAITQKMLTQQLREMEKDRLISRTVYPQVPPKVEYALTEHGKSLQSVLKALSDWGDTHHVN